MYRLVNVGGRAALARSDEFWDLEQLSDGAFGTDPMDALAHADQLHGLNDRLDDTPPTGLLEPSQLGPPVPRPPKSFVIGLNYAGHAAEANTPPPKVPAVYTKFPSAITGPNSIVELRSDRCDYEGELVVVIGAGGHDIPADDAWSRIAGLMVGQDLSDRGAQFMGDPPAINLGKSFDTHGPIGPALVSLDSFADPADLRLRTWVNGELRQDDRTKHLLFDIPTLLAFISRICTLVPGDVIFTGTPAGVGLPTRTFLADGDVITTEIEGIGTIENRCVRITDWRGDRNP